MEPFEIDYFGVILTVLPQSDLTFTIFSDGELLGTIDPVITDDAQVCWVSTDIADQEEAGRIGALIENYHNGYN